jgi:hypothetical protein
MRRVLLIAAVFLMAQADAYRVRLAINPAVGKNVEVSSEGKSTQSLTVTDPAGKVLQSQTLENSEAQAWSGTTLSHAGRDITFRRTWSKAEQVSDGKTTVLPLQGSSATFTVKGDDVQIDFSNGRDPDPDVRALLTEIVRRSARAEADNSCVPGRGLAVGETWTLTSAQTNDCFNTFAAVGPASATGTLTSVDHGYATVDFKFAMHLAEIGNLKYDTSAAIDGTVRFRVALNSANDWTATRTMHLTGTAHLPGDQASIRTDVKSSTTQTSALR